MATTTETTASQGNTRSVTSDQCVELRAIGWNGYRKLLRIRGEKNRPKMVYLDGDLLLMSPAFAHEFLSKRLGQFVAEVVVGLDIPCIPAGETTLRRRKKKGGAEPDQSFYLESFEPIRKKLGKENIDLRQDPPPDLVIEAVHTHEASAAIEVWRRFGVPEVWVCDASSLRILILQADGKYVESPLSRAFPYLAASEILGWISRPVSGSETVWMKDLRRWVAETLPGRRAAIENASGEKKED